MNARLSVITTVTFLFATHVTHAIHEKFDQRMDVLVYELSSYFRTNCMVCVSSSFTDQSTTTQISKSLSTKCVSTTIMHIETLQAKWLQLHQRCRRPIYLIMDDTERVMNALQQISTSRHPRTMSRPVWIFLSTRNDPLSENFRGIDVPFDCEFLHVHFGEQNITMTEVYRVAANLSLLMQPFGYMDLESGFVGPKTGFYSRRHSLQGMVLRATNVHDPPLSAIEMDKDTMRLGGFCGRLWSILESRMNFTTVHSIPPEGGNRWEEMMHACEAGDADVTATYISHTSERDKIVDFSFPIATIPLRIFIALRDGRDVRWNDFLTPFTRRLWIAFCCTTLAIAFVLVLLYRWSRLHGDSGESDYPPGDAIFLVFGAIFCQQGHTKTPVSTPCRIMHVSMYLMGMMAISSYSGVLISNLTVYIQSMPFETMEQLYKEPSYSFGMINKSLSHIILQKAQSGLLKKLHDKHVARNPLNAPPTYEQGFARVCKDRFAFIGLSEALTRLRETLNCSIVYLPQQFLVFSASYAFPKGSPYRGLFNHNLLKLMNGGVLKDLHRAALNEKPTTPSEDLSPISLESVTPILSIVAVGIAMAVLFWSMEHAVLAVARCLRLKEGNVLRRRQRVVKVLGRQRKKAWVDSNAFWE